jgi:HlyD family secretion protein
MKKVILLCALLIIGCGKQVKNQVESFKVKKGEFNIEVVETGEIQAVEAINISSPPMSWRFGQLKITKIIEDGTEVAKGDTVIVFDPSEVEKANVDARMELEIAKAELEKMKAEQESKIQELESDLQIAEISYEISKLNLEQAVYEPEITKKEIGLNLEKANISLQEAREEIENQKKIHVEEIHQKELKINQLQNNLNEADQTLRNLTVISTGDGIAILRKNWQTGNKWQVGDQTWSGNPLIDLPDLRVLRVETEINEVDISKIALGQKVEIRLDAFSDTLFHGTVTEIAALAKIKDQEKKSKIKIFPVKILVEGTSKKLMPGMTVSSKIIVDKVDDVLFIPLEAVQKDAGQDYVYLKKGSAYQRRDVVTGESNNDFVIIKEGLTEGDAVALANPFEKETVKGEKP